MKWLQRLWIQVKALYEKQPEVFRFVMAMLWLVITWAVIIKVIKIIWHQLDKIEWVQQVEPYISRFIIYLPFAFIAIAFLMAFNRITELLKK
jgi:uncharacterized membrane protein (Fun14 family)